MPTVMPPIPAMTATTIERFTAESSAVALRYDPRNIGRRRLRLYPPEEGESARTRGYD
jgi:hypothetical protein